MSSRAGRSHKSTDFMVSLVSHFTFWVYDMRGQGSLAGLGTQCCSSYKNNNLLQMFAHFPAARSFVNGTCCSYHMLGFDCVQYCVCGL